MPRATSRASPTASIVATSSTASSSGSPGPPPTPCRSPAPRLSGTPFKRTSSAGRVDDDGRDNGLGGGRPWAGRADVAAAEDRGGAAAPAGRGPGDGLPLAGRNGGDTDHVAGRVPGRRRGGPDDSA